MSNLSLIRTLKYQLVPGWNSLTTQGVLSKATTHIAEQADGITMWVPVDESAPAHLQRIYVALTGEPVPAASTGKEMVYLGTCLRFGGGFVVHAYIEI